MPTHPFFGADPESYNLDLDSDDFHHAPASDGSGRPGIGIVSSALLFWVGQQPGCPTVADAARVFFMPAAAVVEAAKWSQWLTLEGDPDGPLESLTIGMDGA